MNKANLRILCEFYTDNYLYIQLCENYKWEAIEQFQNNFDINAIDFKSNLEKSIMRCNLVHGGRYEILNGLLQVAEKSPENLRDLFKMLYDETQPLRDRAQTFMDLINDELEQCGANSPYYRQDIRAVFVYLSLKYPEKYFLYKYNVYQSFEKFIQVEGLDNEDAIGRAEAYEKLCEDCLTIIKNEMPELIELDSNRWVTFHDINHHMLMQDIAYSLVYFTEPTILKESSLKEKKALERAGKAIMPNGKTERIRWIIPANPNYYDVENAFLNLVKVDWHQTKQMKNMQVDDIVYVYGSGELKRVLFKCVVNKVSLNIQEIEDSEYYINPLNAGQSGPFIELQAITQYANNIEELTYKNMKDHGLQGQLMSAMHVNPELQAYIEKGEENQAAAERIWGGNEDFRKELVERQQNRRIDEMDVETLRGLAEKQIEGQVSYKTKKVKEPKRNRAVERYAKVRAKGICQLCNQPAPFENNNGEPYLETHHIIWLAEGGPDTIENTVALCPNCHKKMHVVADPNDVIKLQNANK